MPLTEGWNWNDQPTLVAAVMPYELAVGISIALVCVLLLALLRSF